MALELSDSQSAWVRRRSKSTQRYWELVRVLVQRSLRTRYRGSILGIYWSLLNPVLKTALYTIIFGQAFVSYYNDSMVEYILAAFTGLLGINYFSAATMQALASIVSQGMLLNKLQLPVSIFPVSAVAANFIQTVLSGVPFLMLMTLITSKSLVNLLALFVPLISITMVCLGFGLLMSALYVFFRDLSYFYEIFVFTIAMSSPVFYPAEILPERAQQILFLNPVYFAIEGIRQVSLSGQPPDAYLLTGGLISGIVMMILGFFTFRRLQPHFMDLL